MFAIDGVKLPSNADKRRSGTHAELRHEAERMEVAVATMMKAHRARDQEKDPGEDQAKDEARLQRLQSEATRIREFLATHSERHSEKGAIRKSNLTDNDSAKMATAKGVLQGYSALAAVDAKAQIIVAAQAHGSGSEQSALLPMVRSTEALRTEQTMVTADAGYHSEENLKQLYESGVPALIADNLMRRRDERFRDQAKYTGLPDPLWDKTATLREGKFTPADFHHDPNTNRCICPAGKSLYSTGRHCTTKAECITSSRAPSATVCPATSETVVFVTRSAPRRVRSRSSRRTSPRPCHSPSA